MSDDPSKLAQNFLLEQLLAESRSHGAKLDAQDAKLDEVLERSKRLTNHFLRIAERQRRDREAARATELRVATLEQTVFGAQRQGAPPAASALVTPSPWQPRPPMPSYSEDSSVHDIEALKADLAGLKPHVESARRRESWWYRERNTTVLRVAAAVAIAVATALVTWAAAHVHVGSLDHESRRVTVA